MSLFKCKMCGGTIEFEEGSTVGVCDSCGTKQTLPKTNSEAIANMFNRANNLRLKAEFDRAEEIYERIVQEDDSEAEAHWGLVLCRYGIEYVEDPATHERIPTCHRTLYEPVTQDVDYLAAIDYSDTFQQSIYEKEARAIDRIQKGILEIVKKEKPFDVFICYKETDENGKRTVDSVIANDIYYQLTQEGFKVFYAAITLEDKLGQEYEPYIFAALNSAKVMLVLGTKPEYFNAVWVKNEWSRFMKLMKSDRSRLLIPCYRDMDAYDLPDEFAHLQAQDMSKIGFINDVVRGINKVIKVDEPDLTKSSNSVTSGTVAAPTVESMLKRIFLLLEEGEWEKADDLLEQILNQDPENAQAYLGKLLIELRVNCKEDLEKCGQSFENSNNYRNVVRFGDAALKEELHNYISIINEKSVDEQFNVIYEEALQRMKNAKSESSFKKIAAQFSSLSGYKDADTLSSKCLELAEDAGRNQIYNDALFYMNNANSETTYKIAAKKFSQVGGYKDADDLAKQCLSNAEISRKDSVYDLAVSKMKEESVSSYQKAIDLLQTIAGWKDADELLDEIGKKSEQLQEEKDQVLLTSVMPLLKKNTIASNFSAINTLEKIARSKDVEQIIDDAKKKLLRKRKTYTVVLTVVYCIVVIVIFSFIFRYFF